MKALEIVFYVAMSLWLVSEVYYAISLKAENKSKENKDKSSFGLLWIVIPISISLSIFVSYINAPAIAQGEWISWLGISLVLVGIITRFFIIKSLGKYFTVDVNISNDHQMKTTGFYSIIRHPSYAFSMLTFLGLGLALNNWASLAIALIPPFLAFYYRIIVEEKALNERFGQQYEAYSAKTKKIIPFIY